MSYMWFEWTQDGKLSKICKMQKMFQGKNASNTNGKPIVNVKIITTIMNVMDVNVATKSRITKKQMFHE